MRYLLIDEVLQLHDRLIAATGGATGLRDRGALESAVAQPRMTFSGVDLYPQLTDKAAALCFSLVMNHPFVDGNKRIGHAAMETMLVINGVELIATVEDSEATILSLAAGSLSRAEFTTWVKDRARPLDAATGG